MEKNMSDFLSTAEVAKRLSVSKPTIIRMLEKGELDGFRVCRQYRIKQESVERLINHNLNNGDKK
jgi:excisionase family DNA binding protein